METECRKLNMDSLCTIDWQWMLTFLKVKSTLDLERTRDTNSKYADPYSHHPMVATFHGSEKIKLFN
jgi:hypothetical protein